LTGIKDPVLICWYFGERHSSEPFPYSFPKGIYCAHSSAASSWEPLTVDTKTGVTPLSASFNRYGIGFGSTSNYPDVITIGPQVTTAQPVEITDVTTRIITGTLTEKGIKAVGEGTQTVEVALSAGNLQALTQAYARLECCIEALHYIPGFLGDDGSFEEDSWRFNINLMVTATSADGTETALTPIEPYSYFGSINTFRRYLLLPRNTVQLNVKWEFTDVAYEHVVIINEETDHIEGETNVYDQIYLRSYGSNSGDAESKLLAICPLIAQRGCEERSIASENLSLSVDPATWYDIDGDGVKEWANGELCKFNADLLGQHTLNKKFQRISGWVTYDGNNLGAYSDKEIYALNGFTLTEKASTENSFALMDYNNDGRTDFLIQYDNNRVMSCCANGEFAECKLDVMTPNEFYNYITQHPNSGLGSGVSFIGGTGPKTAPGAFSAYSQLDINNDGYLDFIDPSGRYLLNTGSGRYVSDTFGGSVMFRDFDGDGITDKLTYDTEEKSITVSLQRRNGEPVNRQLFSGLNCSQHIWCHDFDKDGDIDILVPFDGSANGEQSYLVMFENNGQGTFKRHENFIEGGYDFCACADWDSDGKYEVLSAQYSSSYPKPSTRTVSSFKVDGLKVSTTPETLHSGAGEPETFRYDRMFVGDIDNSGLQRLVFCDAMLTPSANANTAPAQPERPKVSYDPSTGEVTVSWERASDRESAPLDLTYELRIGTAPDRGDILHADAKADGSRLNLLEGNCGYALQRRLNAASWPAGNIYVSVQAIDGGGMGSPFSEYAVFEKQQPAAAFNLSTPEFMTVGDECVFSFLNAPAQADELTWQLGDGGEIKSQTATEVRVAWSTPGDKNVVLTATTPQGASATCSRTVHIAPVRVESMKDLNVNDGVVLALDMDLDGETELVTRNSSAPFLEGDADGNYSAIKRLFNTNVAADFEYGKVVDINRDGLPDVCAPGYHFINESDKSMQISKIENIKTLTPGIDFDNDGLTDFKYDGLMRFYRNNGDYINYTDVNLPAYGGDLWYDYNGDGLIDIIEIGRHSTGYDTYYNEMTVYANCGNYEFVEIERIEVEDMESYSGNQKLCGDLDGDGRIDIAWTHAGGGYGTSWYSDNAYIRWADGTVTAIPAPSGHQFGNVLNVFDYDNNGCMDLLVYVTGKDSYAIIYFNPDRSWRLEEAGNTDDRTTVYKRTDGLRGIGSSRIVGQRPNTPPTAPTDLRATQNAAAIVIEWNRATDAETPSAALRYNISVKHKGREGEGAYFMSPLNGGLNGIAVTYGAQLLTSNRITIPATVIPAGEYEVKVQAVDTQWEQSDFSETLNLTVAATAAVDMPASTMVGQPTPVRIYAGYTADDIDFGSGATVESAAGNEVSVSWNTEGLKTVRADGFSTQIYVYPRLDASFTLPEKIYIGDKVRVACDASHGGDSWTVASGGISTGLDFFVSVAQHKFVSMTRIDDHTVEFTFTSRGSYRLNHSISEDYGYADCTVRADVYDGRTGLELNLVDIDEATGKHRLTWAVPGEWAAEVEAVNVYKESSRLNDYELLATLPADATSFVDPGSVPDVHASRYSISYTLTCGESAMAPAHRPIHVQLNRGIGTAWNLSWTPYEGRDITSYRILRGTSPADLALVDEVSGAITSYSDFTAPDADCFYAVEILADAPQSRAAAAGSRSNVVSTATAGTAVLAASVEIASATGSFAISGADGGNTLQLTAYIYPVHATFTRVDWVIADGADIASISPSGLLTATANGTITVRAYAVDGSGVYGEAVITIDEISGIDAVAPHGGDSLTVSAGPSCASITIDGIDASAESPATVSIYDLHGRRIHASTATAPRLTVSSRTWAPGLYIVRARTATARFVKR